MFGLRNLLSPKTKVTPTSDNMAVVVGVLESNRPDMIVETARQLICGLDPNGCVHALVGYYNVKNINLPVSKRLRAEQIKTGVKDEPCPDTIETFARFIVKSPMPNEPSRRRCYWFLCGLFNYEGRGNRRT